jgi:hypothetical protein
LGLLGILFIALSAFKRYRPTSSKDNRRSCLPGPSWAGHPEGRKSRLPGICPLQVLSLLVGQNFCPGGLERIFANYKLLIGSSRSLNHFLSSNKTKQRGLDYMCTTPFGPSHTINSSVQRTLDNPC